MVLAAQQTVSPMQTVRRVTVPTHSAQVVLLAIPHSLRPATLSLGRVQVPMVVQRVLPVRQVGLLQLRSPPSLSRQTQSHTMDDPRSLGALLAPPVVPQGVPGLTQAHRAAVVSRIHSQPTPHSRSNALAQEEHQHCSR